jgi:hypothetical protein
LGQNNVSVLSIIVAMICFSFIINVSVSKILLCLCFHYVCFKKLFLCSAFLDYQLKCGGSKWGRKYDFDLITLVLVQTSKTVHSWELHFVATFKGYLVCPLVCTYGDKYKCL